MPAEESRCSAIAALGLCLDSICIACHRFCILVCGTLIYGRGDEVEEKEIVAEMAAEAGQPIGACCFPFYSRCMVHSSANCSICADESPDGVCQLPMKHGYCGAIESAHMSYALPGSAPNVVQAGQILTKLLSPM